MDNFNAYCTYMLLMDIHFESFLGSEESNFQIVYFQACENNLISTSITVLQFINRATVQNNCMSRILELLMLKYVIYLTNAVLEIEIENILFMRHFDLHKPHS